MNITTVSSVLKLFFAFNNVEDSSVELIESSYDDKWFRWTRDTFKHGQTLTALYNDSKIMIFGTDKVRDRLAANTSKIQQDKEVKNFACHFDIVKDLLFVIEANEISEIDKEEYERFIKESRKKDKKV